MEAIASLVTLNAPADAIGPVMSLHVLEVPILQRVRVRVRVRIQLRAVARRNANHSPRARAGASAFLSQEPERVQVGGFVGHPIQHIASG